MARLERDPVPGFEHPPDDCKDVSGFYAKQDVKLEALQKVSDALPKGKLKGFILRFPRGDGHALYLVTNEKPLTVAWIAWSDAWQVEGALIRGLDVEDCLRQQEQCLFWAKEAKKRTKELKRTAKV